jgi:hypothetical protein
VPRTFPSALTPEQVRAIDASCRLLADASWTDGYVTNVLPRLPGEGPWADSEINDAIRSEAAVYETKGARHLPTSTRPRLSKLK